MEANSPVPFAAAVPAVADAVDQDVMSEVAAGDVVDVVLDVVVAGSAVVV